MRARRDTSFSGFLVLGGAMLALSLSVEGASVNGRSGDGDGSYQYEISVTNLTRGQPFSPPVVVSHDKSLVPLFTPGMPADAELTLVAEDGMNGALVTELQADPAVLDVEEMFGSMGPILPGETATVTLLADESFDRLSLVGMLVTTNDAFVGLSMLHLPRRGGDRLLVLAYDAGTETNNEDCDFIPGPPCMNAGVRDTSGAEGYVHVHAGIHGVGDLPENQHDWRNPVALVTVRRIDL